MLLYSKVDIGKVRKSNQDAADAFMIDSNTAFAIVCDGMGGANAGDIASKKAIETISEYVKSSYSPNMDTEKAMRILKNAVFSANMEVFKLSHTVAELNGMGTTVVAAIVSNNRAVICHIGDSRAYLVNDAITQITTDHSVVQSLIESGKLSLSEAKDFPEKNVITRALGVEENVFSDYNVVPLKPDDYLLLCSDGLTNYVENDLILDIFKNNSADTVADKLISAAMSNGGGDNISVVIVSQERG